ncbi:hypothetical protein [Desulfuromonas acetoxidans]|uniref:hypothetical protein n=1 Tax=Desulfuromonas acetoxidans TaxID=891 RepID=UPI002931A210|nr:hypothetical protein [Desulfuromonas acetoxidans]
MSRFATYSNEAGYNVTGHYSVDKWRQCFIEVLDIDGVGTGDYIPAPDGPLAGAVAITDEEWRLSIDGRLRIDPVTQEVAEYVKPADEQLADAKMRQVDSINSAFLAETTGSVECTVGELTLTMDAGYENATKLDDGITLAERLGETVITITDYNNVDHDGITLADALQVSTQQAAHYAVSRATRNTLRTQINAIEIGDGTLEDALAAVQAVAWPE